jgi:predicted transcriptional regulator
LSQEEFSRRFESVVYEIWEVQIMKERILALRKLGKSYNKIVKTLGCSKSMVCYYCGENQKEKTVARTKCKRASQHPYVKKLEHFIETSKSHKCSPVSKTIKQMLHGKIRTFHTDGRECKMTFTVKDVINKFGERPKCYLTGRNVEIEKPRTYHFDHILPRSRGGTNTLENLGICTREANQAKCDLTVPEFIQLCRDVLEHHGYKVT